MERIVFLERDTFKVDFRLPQFEHDWIEYGETTADQIIERLREATIVICNKLPLRKTHLSHLPRVKLIAVAATGVDNIDLGYCRSHNVAVCNTRNYAVHSLPEHVLLLILALRRNLVNYWEDVKQGQWQKAKQFCLLDHSIGDLYGSTIGIVGFGFLGRAVGQLAHALGMNVVISERKNAVTVRDGRVRFEDLLQQSDVISLHCPLNEETRNLMAAPQFDRMKRDALLINTARGGLVDEESLVTALKTGLIGGAALDVLKAEPPREGNPLLDLRLPNLIITPHIAWASNEAMQTLADQLVDNLEAFVRGERRNRIV